MSDLTDITARMQRFRDAVRDFKLPAPSRHAKLMPLRDGIIELRHKGASLRLIRELLATVSIAVGTDTIARFLAEVNGEPQPLQIHKRSVRARRPRVGMASEQPAAVPTVAGATAASLPSPQSSSSTSAATTDAEKPPERSRARG